MSEGKVKRYDSEMVIGLVGAMGTPLERVGNIISEKLKLIGYATTEIKISKDIIQGIGGGNEEMPENEYARIIQLMDAGNDARKESKNNAILALGVASRISSLRKKDDTGQFSPSQKTAYIVSSFKHPEEVRCIREIYPKGFYLFGVSSDEKRRRNYLNNEKGIKDRDKIDILIKRDMDEHLPHGQNVADTFHLSDFFVRIDGNEDGLKYSIWRIIEILFGHPYKTPTFDEYAMFLAFAASLRSADLSRQVGAVIARDHEILATGANDCPKAGGGLYWPKINREGRITDAKDGRDYKRGKDTNKVEQQRIIDNILQNAESKQIDKSKLEVVLKESRITELTEFGRVVHAEMEAILTCARNGVSTSGGALYCTTYPCHNCAKHIISSGLKRVIYIEPYPKSKASEFHSDSIQHGVLESDRETHTKNSVRFDAFVGVGPRRFFDLFSMGLGSGSSIKRKDKNGNILEWKEDDASLRLQMLPYSYLDSELEACNEFNAFRMKTQKEKENGSP